MIGSWRVALAAVGVAAAGGLLAGLMFGYSAPEPDVGEPVVLTPAEASAEGTLSRRAPRERDDDNDIREVERSPRPVGGSGRADSEDVGFDDNSDDAPAPPQSGAGTGGGGGPVGGGDDDDGDDGDDDRDDDRDDNRDDDGGGEGGDDDGGDD